MYKKFLIAVFIFVVGLGTADADVTATASTTEKSESPPGHIVDGDINTRWSSNFLDNQWVVIDLGKVATIDTIEIYWENAYAKKYGVLVSKDNQKWKPVYLTDDGDGGLDVIQFNETQAKYVKINCIKRGTEWGNSIFEIVVKGVNSLKNEIPDPDIRVHFKMIKEDPLVLEWLKVIQDTGTPDKQLVTTMEDNLISTFNNALVAIAFIVKGEKERAERILDFFAAAVDKKNTVIDRQNFYYKGEARGFFQYSVYKNEPGKKGYYYAWPCDRWMGDMAWLLTAYKYYEKEYNSAKYTKVQELLKNLLISWFVPDGDGGYVGHGWRNGDAKLHEGFGHEEGNIDVYAVFRLCGANQYADKIKKWLDRKCQGNTLPLDLYTWRVLAYGKEAAGLLNIPEYEGGFRKILMINGTKITGFYHGSDRDAQNIWMDGTGHMACAYLAVGDTNKGYLYSNQMDAFLIDREINGVKCKGLPYTANNVNYEWVDTQKGNNSVAAWYIFAKNLLNPLKLTKSEEKPIYMDNPYKPFKGTADASFGGLKKWSIKGENDIPCGMFVNEKGEMEIEFSFTKGGWVIVSNASDFPKAKNSQVSFELKSEGIPNTLEIKWVDEDGSVFGKKIENVNIKEFRSFTLKPSDFTHWWGGDGKLDKVTEFHIAISKLKGGKGKIYIKNLKIGN
ncbi:MAG: discoidin domain-containing protein [Elusimicrobia bacterium]|nr:discoidin domain-containing protein [Elusimicrobiota bacterium]